MKIKTKREEYVKPTNKKNDQNKNGVKQPEGTLPRKLTNGKIDGNLQKWNEVANKKGKGPANSLSHHKKTMGNGKDMNITSKN